MRTDGEVQIADLSTRVQFERRSLTQDSVGGQSETWTTISTVWADIEAMSGRELEAAQAVRSTDTHIITVRFIPNLSAKDRFRFTDSDGTVRIYDITDVINIDMAYRYQSCTAIQGLAPG